MARDRSPLPGKTLSRLPPTRRENVRNTGEWRYFHRVAAYVVEKDDRPEMLLIVRASSELFLANRLNQSIDGTEAGEIWTVVSSSEQREGWPTYQVIRLSNLDAYLV